MNTHRDLKMGRALASIPLPELSDEYYSRLADTLEQARPAPPRAPGRSRILRLGAAAAAVAAAAVFAFAVLPALRGTDTATAGDMLASMNAAAGNADVVRLTITEQRVPRGRSETEQLTLSTSGDIRFTSVREHEDAMHRAVTTHMLETYDEQRHEMRRQGSTAPADDSATPPADAAVPADDAGVTPGSADVPADAVTLQPTPYGTYAPAPSPYDGGPGPLIIERPSWGTDIFAAFLYANFQALANSLRARLAAGDPNAPVTVTTYLGRPAWHADLTELMPTNDSRSPDGLLVRWSVTVDKATGLLMASDLAPGSGAGELKGLARSFKVTRIEVDPQLPDGWQRIPQSKRGDIAIFDPGTRFGTPEEVAKRSWPTLVLIPRTVPAGYRLSDVATRDYEGMSRASNDQSKLVYRSRSNPRKYLWKRTHIDASAQRVMVRFRRGFSTFVIAIKPFTNGAGSLGADTAGRLGAEDVTLTAGSLEGARARTWISPYFVGGPTLITYSDRSRITITGDLTRQELIDVANSFKAYGDVEGPLPKGYGK